MPLVMSTISGQLLRPDLTGARLSVTLSAATAGTILEYAGQVIVGKYRVDVDGETGNASVTIPQIPQAGLTPAGARWRLTFSAAGVKDFWDFNLTGDTTWDAIVDVSSTPVTNSVQVAAEAARDAALAAVASVAVSTWQASTSVVANQVVKAPSPDGSEISSNSSRTTRASFDATEQTFWTPVVTKSGAMSKAALDAAYLPVFTPEKYGAVGDGVADDTTAVLAAFTAANALARVSGTYSNAGARVLLKKRYNLATLSSQIPVVCHLDGAGAELLAPSGYTGAVLAIGHPTSGSVLENAEIQGPSVTGVTTATMATLPVGSIGVLIRNLYSSRVRVGKVLYFETGMRVGGQSWGVAYNEIGFRTISFCKVNLKVGGLDATGWANQNTFIAGGVTGSSTWAGGRRATGTRAVLLDGTGSNTVTGNVFVGCAFESDTFEHAIEVRNGYQNQWFGCRHEQGVAAASATVSGATFTATAHPLAVDDMVIISGTSAPPEISFDRPYYVVAVTTNTFQISLAKGGTAITTTSAGSGLTFSRPQRVRFENSYDNMIYHPMGPLVWLEKVESGTPAATAGNMIRYAGQGETRDSYMPASWPIHRARNRASTGGSFPLWAAYPAAKDPYTDPGSWTAALDDVGLRLGSGGGSGVITANSGGTLRWIRPSDSPATFEIASCQRTQSATTLTSGTVYTAGSRTTGTVTLTGASVGDYVAWTSTSGMLPFGLQVSAQVTSANTITYAIDNMSAASVTLGSAFSLFFMATRRFF